MKILVAGNLVNYGFYLTQKLRELNLDVELLIQKNPPKTADPMDTGLISNTYPNWIKFYNMKDWKWKFDVISKMRKYELIIAMTELPIFALLSSKPFISITTGADTRELIHETSLKGFLLKLAYKFSKLVIYVMPIQKSIIKKNKIQKSIFIPILKNQMKYLEKRNNKKFTIFHPTNHIWKDKGNDIFLNAYIEIAKKRNDIHLIILKRGIDIDKSIGLLESANMGDKFEVIDSTLNQEEMAEMYSRSDAIADQFSLGSLGLVGIDCLSLGKPLISYVDKTAYSEGYGEIPPAISSKNSEELEKNILKIIDDKEFYEQVAKKSSSWYQKFHSEEVLIKKYKKIIEMIFSKKKFEEIDKEIHEI